MHSTPDQQTDPDRALRSTLLLAAARAQAGSVCLREILTDEETSVMGSINAAENALRKSFLAVRRLRNDLRRGKAAA